jgi:signal transduction histidine kinase
VVDKHQGEIFFETETGRGTTFVIRLPQAEKKGGREVAKN